MPSPTSTLLSTYGRNINVMAYKRGWTPQQLATRLGISTNALNRVRFARCRYIDPEILIGLSELFGCDFNDLLKPQPGVDYASDA